MHMRQTRLSGPLQIRTHLAELVGKKINIVLHDNSVVFGELLSVLPNSIQVLNMRQRQMEIAINDMYELHVDVNA